MPQPTSRCAYRTTGPRDHVVGGPLGAPSRLASELACAGGPLAFSARTLSRLYWALETCGEDEQRSHRANAFRC
uniref:Uncharacterized protein n=1 Tax=Setaria italica TaxID=4555 RepID=K3YP20_SETIT